MHLSEPTPEWGGPWTERKLETFTKYVRSYLTIMNRNPYWKTIYFDGFAGSGTRKQSKSELYEQLPINTEDERLYRGSAERVLKIPPPLGFDYYYFVDRNAISLEKLEKRLSALPESNAKNLVFRPGNANEELLRLAGALKKKKPSYAALIFLDPFGMQIDWSSIGALKDTRSDVWILIPTGVIINRLLDRKGELKNLKKLESFFGLTEEEIRKEFYLTEATPTLFGDEEVVKKVLNPIEKIAQLYAKRLNNIWEFVTPKPLRLDNTRGTPIFHFVFASNNVNARKIANQILEKS
jgi:three-Cys-motif partner protein